MPLDVNARFGNAVKRFRTAAEISQEDLADRSGLHRTYVSLLERGKRNPSLQVIIALANSLGISPAALVESATSEP